jgi:hypothetical protein
VTTESKPVGDDDKFNHTGSVGLGFWEDNEPTHTVIKDLALEIMRFMMCGNIFYPVLGDWVPIEKHIISLQGGCNIFRV